MSSKLFDFTETEYENAFHGKTIAVSMHTHSHFSLDGGSSVENMMDKAVDLGYSHFTLSEHGNLNSCADMWAYAEKLKKKGKFLRPFHSVEAYIKFPEDKKETHITIGFKTQEAYQCYCRLTPKLFSREQMVVKFGDAKPVMTVAQLEELAGFGITVGTGCIGSWLNRLVMNGLFQEARMRLEWMISVVGKENIYEEWIVDDLSKFYVKPIYDENKRIITAARLEDNECHPVFGDKDVGRGCNIARRDNVTQRYGLKPIASLDAHYAFKKDKVVQDAKNYGSDWVMSSFQHLKNAGEFAFEAKKNQQLDDKFIEELIDNTHDYADQFSGYKFSTAKDGWLMPIYEENKQWVADAVKAKGKIDLTNPVYAERLQYEISVFADNGVSDFLNYVRQVREIVEIAEKHGVLCNVRGSAGGSLLYYALGISVTDPILFDLPFERHLTNGRIRSGSIPDVDLDFSDKDRMDFLLKEHYGDRLVPLSIDMLLKPRSAMKDAERAVLGHVRPETEMLTKTMPQVPQGVDESDWLFGYEGEGGDHVQGFFEKSSELQAYAKSSPEIWNLVVSMCGVQRQKGVHACSYVILPTAASNYFPLYKVGGKDGELATAFGPKGIEYIGGVKLDILGVKKMLTIQECLAMVKTRTGVEIPWGQFPHDPAVYKEVMHTGMTIGTFQTSTQGITDLCVRSKPNSIEDISTLIALYRPSCLDAYPTWDDSFRGNLVDYYIAGRNGTHKPRYIHDDLIPIYGSTQASPVFQEQILRTFRDIGGMSYEEAEAARRAIGKKDVAALAAEGQKLKTACLARGWSEKQADELFQVIMASSRYGFNQAHSASYGIVSYATAYLKFHYPLEFWCAELSCEYDNEDKLRLYSDFLGKQILAPDILQSHPSRFLIEDQKIRAPMAAIKGVGESVVEEIQSLLNNSLESLGLVRKPTDTGAKKRVGSNKKQDAVEG